MSMHIPVAPVECATGMICRCPFPLSVSVVRFRCPFPLSVSVSVVPLSVPQPSFSVQRSAFSAQRSTLNAQRPTPWSVSTARPQAVHLEQTRIVLPDQEASLQPLRARARCRLRAARARALREAVLDHASSDSACWAIARGLGSSSGPRRGRPGPRPGRPPSESVRRTPGRAEPRTPGLAAGSRVGAMSLDVVRGAEGATRRRRAGGDAP